MQAAFAMRVLKESGNHLRNKARQNLIIVFLCSMVFALIFLSSHPIFPLYIDVGRYEGVRALSMVFPMILGLQFFRQYRGYKNGLHGERQLTGLLGSALDNQYALLNDVDFRDGYGNIDHVVLGPTGVFAIETKNQRGMIECNGDVWNGVIGKNPGKQARNNAKRVYNAIPSSEVFESGKPWVNAVVVFTHRYANLDIHHKPNNVEILKIDGLVKHLTEGPRRLSSQEIELIGKEILKKVRVSRREAQFFGQ